MSLERRQQPPGAIGDFRDRAVESFGMACEGELKPDSLRTNCSAEAWISACVAGGSKLNSVLMLRHMVLSFARDALAVSQDERPAQIPTMNSILS
jgi:hypothetical protein